MKSKQAPPASFHSGRHLEILDAPVNDPYEQHQKFSEPAVCSDCGAVYHQGHWQWTAAPTGAQHVRCAACRRIKENFPAGYVAIEGPFALAHREEIMSLIRHLEQHEKAEHPQNRIMAIEEEGRNLMVTTTDIHIARAIGDALEDAYKGDLDFHYNKDDYLLRVRWHR